MRTAQGIEQRELEDEVFEATLAQDPGYSPASVHELVREGAL